MTGLPFSPGILSFPSLCRLFTIVREIDEYIYPKDNNDYGFYSAKVLKDKGYFESSFKIYQLMKDYRHINDCLYKFLLDNVRIGKATEGMLKTLNTRVSHDYIFEPNIQYLTATNNQAASINQRFLDSLNSEEYILEPQVDYLSPSFSYMPSLYNRDCQLNYTLILKEGMKAIFTKNDREDRGFRWANGTQCIVRKINVNSNTNDVDSIVVDIQGKQVLVERDKVPAYLLKKN
jgi:hypothetical protein